MLGITVLAVAMLLLGSLAVTFSTNSESERWFQMGATGFFAAMSLSALCFISRVARTWWLPISLSPDLSPRLRWTFAALALIPVDIVAMGLGCGGCHLVCLSLLGGHLDARWSASGGGHSPPAGSLHRGPRTKRAIFQIWAIRH